MRVAFLLWPFHLCKLLISLWTCMWECEDFIVMIMKIAVFWHVMLCSFLDTYEHCGRTCIPYVVGKMVNRRANFSTLKMKDAGRMFLWNVSVDVLNYKMSEPRRWRMLAGCFCEMSVLMYWTTRCHNPEDEGCWQDVSVKCQCWCTELQDVTTLKMKDAGRMFLWNVSVDVLNYKMSQPRRQ